ncbi:MAG: hypothetical protein OEZ35_09845, partial [Candidatus Bathyarchaeota archaeon]|nr:hypothetical protein [Candidatus Bathyarchaeota archaeon]
IIAVLAVLLLKRKSKQLLYATYQTTIEATLHAVFVASLIDPKIFPLTVKADRLINMKTL